MRKTWKNIVTNGYGIIWPQKRGESFTSYNDRLGAHRSYLISWVVDPPFPAIVANADLGWDPQA